MSKDPAFLFYPGDYLEDTQCLGESTQVAYDRIMCLHMKNICISKQQLKFLTKKLSPDELDGLMSALTEIEGGYCIEWVVESISKRKAYSESRRKNRSSKKEKDMYNTSKTYVLHMVNVNEDVNEEEEEEEEIEIEIKNWQDLAQFARKKFKLELNKSLWKFELPPCPHIAIKDKHAWHKKWKPIVDQLNNILDDQNENSNQQ